LGLRLAAVGVSPALLVLREPFKALGRLKELLAGLMTEIRCTRVRISRA
jgi:hypothetical protein